MKIRRLKGAELERFLMTAQNTNRDLFLQISFVLASGLTVCHVCDLTWPEVRSRDWPAELVEILQQCSTEFEPWVFRYRSPGTVSEMLRKIGNP